MNSLARGMTRCALALAVAAVGAGCAATKAGGERVGSAPSAGQPSAQAQSGYPSSVAASPPSAPPSPPPSQPGEPGTAPPRFAPAPNGDSYRQAVESAANQVDLSQRELDVAAGDCRNACRALGSMDRAAGRLCGMTVGGSEARRCDDAKVRVYSARDRVKATCGQCEGGPSVERSAPIPSLR